MLPYLRESDRWRCGAAVQARRRLVLLSACQVNSRKHITNPPPPPPPPPHPKRHGYDITLTASIAPEGAKEETLVADTNFKYM